MKKLLMLVLVASLATQASAAISFDFNFGGGGTEAGFVGVPVSHNASKDRWDITGAIIDENADPATQGIAFTQEGTAGGGVVWAYDWAAGTALGTDGYYSNETMMMTVHNAPAGTWDFTTYHGEDWNGGSGTIDIFIDTILVIDEHIAGTSAAPTAASFTLTSDGVSDYLIEFRSGDGGNGYAFFNGFTTNLPEPATMLLFGLGSVLLRRRK